MIEEQLKEQASLYAIGGLPGSKAREFEHAMQSNLELQLLVTQMRQSLDLMVVSLPRRMPPPALKAKIMLKVEGRRSGAALLAQPAPSGIPFWMAVFPWAIAACLACVCAVMISRNQTGRLRLAELEQRVGELSSQNQKLEVASELQKADFARQRQQLSEMVIRQSGDQNRLYAATTNQLVERIRVMEKRAADVVSGRKPVSSLQASLPDSRNSDSGGRDEDAGGAIQALPGAAAGTPPLVPGRPLLANSGRPNDPKTSYLGLLKSADVNNPIVGAVTWDVLEQRGSVVIEQLPPPDADHDYQLWIITEGVPLSGGLLRFDGTGRVSNSYLIAERVESVQSFKISRERKGGAAETPAGPIILESLN